VPGGLPDDAPDPFAWAEDVAARALEAAGAQDVVVIGKSLTSEAAGLVADRGLPAVWLTPLLHEEVVITGLARARQPTLLIGGTADPSWLPDRLPENPALETLELDGLDHTLQVEGDPRASLDALRRVTEALDGFLAR
jgi:hypothetical protein